MQYDYTKTGAATDRLESEIRTSAIVTAYDTLTYLGGTNLSLFFKGTLSDGDKTILDGLVTNNSGIPLPSAPQAVSVITDPAQKDSDGAVLSRIKAAPTGWTYQLRSYEFTTADLSSIVNKDAITNADQSDVTMKLYDASDVQITDNANKANAVKTIVDYEPHWDYYIMGGSAKIMAVPTSDVRLSVVCVPDVPANYGGSKVMIQNVNLKCHQTVEADGRAAKWLKYDTTYHTNKLRFIARHPAGEQHGISVLLEHFKS